MIWSIEHINFILTLRCQRLSGAQIADQFNEKFDLDVTRQAVLAKLIRLGKEPEEKVKAELAEPIKTLDLPLIALKPEQCRWPTDMISNRHVFCGLVVANDRPYCKTHCRTAYK
jgi:hypothetical protein